jgi:hypothetical protein
MPIEPIRYKWIKDSPMELLVKVNMKKILSVSLTVLTSNTLFVTLTLSNADNSVKTIECDMTHKLLLDYIEYTILNA